MRHRLVLSVLLCVLASGGNATAQTPTTQAPTVLASPSPTPSSAATTFVPVLTSADPIPAMGRWPGRWRRVDRVDGLQPRTGAVVLDHLGVVVWGGIGSDGAPLNDGFRVLPSGTWKRIPPAPIAPRTDFAWADDRAGNLVIWGGIDATGVPLADGAAYSVGYGWTKLNAGPLPPGPAAMAGDLNDMRIVTTDPESGQPVMAVLHRDVVESGTWSEVGPVPLPRGARYEVISCCQAAISTGEGWAIVLSEQADGFADAARIDGIPGQPGWEQLGRVPVGPGTSGPVQGYTTEEELTAWVRAPITPYPGTDLTGPTAVIARTERPDEPWRLGAPAPADAVTDPSLVLAPSHLVSPEALAAWDLVADRWLHIPAGRRGAGITGATAWWDRGRLWVYGGRHPDGSLDDGIWTYTPRLPWRTYALPGRGQRDRGEACYVYIYEGAGPWRLRGDPRDPLLVWAQHGARRVALAWPDGWVVRFRPDLEIVRPDGRVVAREGHRCRIDPASGG